MSRWLKAAVVTAIAVLAVVAPSGARAAGSTVTPGPAWDCSVYGYLFQTPANGTHLIMQVDLASGTAKQLASTAGNLNAAGYNILDNYIYAWDLTSSTIVQVAADGAISRLGDPTRTGAHFTIGDFDDAGHLFLTLQGATEPWYEVDLSPGSANYAKVIASGTRTTPTGLASGADWSWVGGALYMVALPSQGPKTPHLVRFNPSTSESVDLGTLPFTVPGTFTGPLLDVFGATYADQTGNLYASYNGGGQIYRIPVDDMGAASLLTDGPATSYNDGARCVRGSSPGAFVRGDFASLLVLIVLIAFLAALLIVLLLLTRRRRRHA